MRTVLFVDNDEEDMFLFDKAMNIINNKIDIYYGICGDDLYYHLNAFQPDMIFLDISLPDLDGIECLKKLRLIEKALLLPIIIYTAFTSNSFIDECFEEKANYFIIKPKEFERALLLLRRVLSVNWVKEPFPTRDHFVVQ